MHNQVYLVGRVGKDPEVKQVSTDKSVANFSIATSEKWQDKQGEWQEKTEWHRVQAWNRLAHVVNDNVRKGAMVTVVGSLRTRSYESPDGKKYTTYIEASQVITGHTQEPEMGF